MEYNKDDLAYYQQQVARKNKLKTMIEERESQREELSINVEELEKKLFKERKDVERLERLSPSSIFYGMFGKKEERIDKEKKEAVAAAFKYNLAKDELETVVVDIEKMKSEVAELVDAEKMCKEAFDTKVKYIKDHNLSQARELVGLESKIIYFQSQQKEIKEAIDAGRYVLDCANKVKDRLNDADSWNTLDTLGIMDTISWVNKKHAMDEAQEGIAAMHKALAKFKTELSDVNMTVNSENITIGFTGYGDMIFDSFLLDIMTGNKISKAKGDVKQVVEEVRSILDELKYNYTTLTESNYKLQEEYEDLIYSI